MADVLCFGNLQFEVLCRTLTELPAPGALHAIDAIDLALSGNGGNVAAALGRLGISVALAGYSGADTIGEGFRQTLAALGVSVETLPRHPTAGTGTSVTALAPNGERSVLFVNGANALFDLDAVPDAWFEGVRVIYVGSIFVLPQFTGEAVGRLLRRARARGAATVLNVCWDAKGQGLPFLRPALAETDYFILSRDEGRQLTGEDDPARMIAALEAATSCRVALTLGADGCLVHGDEGIERIPAVPVAAVDCTGAGDSFVAGFIAGLVGGRSLAGCARLGCRVASFAVTGPGAYPRIPALGEVDAMALSPV